MWTSLPPVRGTSSSKPSSGSRMLPSRQKIGGLFNHFDNLLTDDTGLDNNMITMTATTSTDHGEDTTSVFASSSLFDFADIAPSVDASLLPPTVDGLCADLPSIADDLDVDADLCSVGLDPTDCSLFGESVDGFADVSGTLEDFVDLREFFDFGAALTSEPELVSASNDGMVPTSADDLVTTVNTDVLQVPVNVTDMATYLDALQPAGTCLDAWQPTGTLISIQAVSFEQQLVPSETSDVPPLVHSPDDHTYHHLSKKRRRCDSDRSDSDKASRLSQYRERRRKNNAASKRSRELRKNRLLDVEDEVKRLEGQNERMRQHVAELERMTACMKAALVDAVQHRPA